MNLCTFTFFYSFLLLYYAIQWGTNMGGGVVFNDTFTTFEIGQIKRMYCLLLGIH